MEEQVTEVKKRPQLLSILCVLTFISTGLGIFTSLLTPMISDYLVEFTRLVYRPLCHSFKANELIFFSL